MGNVEKWSDYLFTRQRWIFHVLFWIGVLAFYAIFFGRENRNYSQTFFFISLLMPVTIGTTYFLNYYLVPQFLLKDRWGLFLLYFIYTLLGSLFLEMMVVVFTFIVMAEVKIKAMSVASKDIVFLLTSLLLVVFFGVAIKMLLHWRKSKEDNARLMHDKVEAEIKFLKMQLNPHFLFNTLNNLYYLATEKSSRAPQAILQLSEILDYVLHASKSVYVPLEKELKQVENYIALELLRYEDRVHIETEVTGSPTEHQIGPMILITIIENAFKHGAMQSAGKSWIKLKVACSDDGLRVEVKNGWQPRPFGDGIGLKNLQNQLDLLYTSKHNLHIDSNNPEAFSVHLELKR